MMSFHESVICQWQFHWYFSWVGTWWLVEKDSWWCHLVGSDISARWKSVSKTIGGEIFKEIDSWLSSKDWMRVSSEEMKLIASERWNDIFSESWWLCSSEWIDDANESLILANVGLGRCSNGLTVDCCRSVEREFLQKRSKWLHQEYVNWWKKAGWWFMAESWK